MTTDTLLRITKDLCHVNCRRHCPANALRRCYSNDGLLGKCSWRPQRSTKKMLETRLWLDITTSTCTKRKFRCNKLRQASLSIFFMFQLVGNICRLTDFFQLGLQGCCQLAQRPTVSNPGSNSRTFVLCNGPCWSASARHPMERARSAMACNWNANW